MNKNYYAITVCDSRSNNKEIFYDVKSNYERAKEKAKTMKQMVGDNKSIRIREIKPLLIEHIVSLFLAKKDALSDYEDDLPEYEEIEVEENE